MSTDPEFKTVETTNGHEIGGNAGKSVNGTETRMMRRHSWLLSKQARARIHVHPCLKWLEIETQTLRVHSCPFVVKNSVVTV